jgi:putative endonuclease
LSQTRKQRIGAWGEKVAAYYLEARGYQVIDRNARTPYGELDLVTRLPELAGAPALVFVEVKTRTNAHFGLPEEAVDARKLDHIARAAETYIQNHAELGEMEWRIDIIAIEGQPGAKVEDVRIEHFQNISA